MSGTLLNTRQIDMRASDALSDVSESGTGTSVSGHTSWDSREELRDLVTMLGLQGIADLYQDRFRVDRKKLEHMLLGDNEAPETAATFFNRIMEETNTFITWPSRLKIGAKSKKDPHVRIAGRPEDVRSAREKILEVLDTRINRVTMKLDVSYTDHSHIIGKGGLCIKRVMEETQCHIHFPDSNRSNPTEKSNQVSIAGEIEGVERARSRVRKLTPLIFSFELPILSSSQPAPDCTTPYVVRVQETYNVQIMFRTRPKLHATLVLVKGVEWEVQQVKEATLVLIDYMCESLASQISVQMSMEISPQHHPVVLGKGSANLRAIMQRTNTQIIFPDANDPNIPSIKKSNITVTGNIHDVYLARQQLMPLENYLTSTSAAEVHNFKYPNMYLFLHNSNCVRFYYEEAAMKSLTRKNIGTFALLPGNGSLPLVLIFDIPEETRGVHIDPEGVAQVMRALDVFISIRHKPKQHTLSVIIKGVERSATNIYEARNRLLGITEPRVIADIPATYLLPPSQAPSPTQNNMHAPVWSYNMAPFNHSQFIGIVPQQRLMYNVMHGSMASSGYHSSLGQHSNSSIDQSQECNTYSSISSGASSAISTPVSSPRIISPSPQNNINNNNNDSTDSMDLSSVLSDISATERKAPGFEKRSQENRPMFSIVDYDQKRVAGYRAMQNKPTGTYRTPTNIWSGYGISYTSPGALNFEKSEDTGSDKDDIWKTPTQTPSPLFSTTITEFASPSTSASSLNTSNYMDHTPTKLLNRITSSKWPDLTSLLTSLGLEKYIGLFSSHEVDLTTFASLTNKDLVEIGVSAFGARRKMLLVISELNKRTTPFSGSAAPGAERKSSCTVSNSNTACDGW